MKEIFFILIVILLLLALTAFRYRKQIAGMIGLARMLKEVKDTAQQGTAQVGVQLVNCAACGVWTPQNKARKQENLFYCSDECSRTAVAR